MDKRDWFWKIVCIGLVAVMVYFARDAFCNLILTAGLIMAGTAAMILFICALAFIKIACSFIFRAVASIEAWYMRCPACNAWPVRAKIIGASDPVDLRNTTIKVLRCWHCGHVSREVLGKMPADRVIPTASELEKMGGEKFK